MDLNTASSSPASVPNAARSASAPPPSAMQGAAKVFREFKWGLLTLFLLMVVVIGLVYDGNKRKNDAGAENTAAPNAGASADRVPETGAGTDGMGGLGALGAPNVPPPTPPGFDDGTGTGLSQNPVGWPSSENHSKLQAPGATPATPKASPARSEVEEKARGANVYVVQPGDTLEGIARRQYPGQVQAGLRALIAANKDQLSDVHRLRPNMKLQTPALPGSVQAPRISTGTPPAEGSAVKSPDKAKPDGSGAAHTYTVIAGDTLERIARKILKDGSRWKELYEWNRDQLTDPGHLRVGQKLRISEAASSTSAVEGSHAGKEVTLTTPVHSGLAAKTNVQPFAAERSASAVVERPTWMP